MLGGLDVLKFSAKPNNDRYQASCEDAILAFFIHIHLRYTMDYLDGWHGLPSHTYKATDCRMKLRQ